jgi:hypothetical protein
MKINRDGTTRLVIILGSFVIKFPRLKDFWGNLFINWNEFAVYIIYRPNLCAPTYFSFFGFFNIQKRGIGINYGDKKAAEFFDSQRDSIEDFCLNFNRHSSEMGHHCGSVLNIHKFGAKYLYVDYGDKPFSTYVIYFKNIKIPTLI